MSAASSAGEMARPPVAAEPAAIAVPIARGGAFGAVVAWASAWAVTGQPSAGIGPAVAAGAVGAVLAWGAVRGRLRPSTAGTPAAAAPDVVDVVTGAGAGAAVPAPTPADPPLAPVLRSFTALFDAVPHVVWRADRNGVILHANQAWLREFRRLRPLRVEDVIELLADDDASAFIAAWDAARQGGGDMRVRCRLRKPGDAEHRWMDLDIRAVHADAGALDGWVGTFTDVQEAMQKIESAQQALYDERRLRERAERLAAMKDEFLATVAHELRSPLNAVAGWTEILARDRGLGESAVHALAIIRRNTRAQAKLIGDLQQLSSMLTGKVAMQPAQMDLGAVARETVGRHASAAAAKSIALVCARIDPAPVHADAGRIALAIDNLVANAIQFTPQGGRVEVAVRTSQHSACLTVGDDGRGIAADRLSTLFDCLQSLDADPSHGRPARRDGLGLGLAVARGMVELNDGSLQVDSGGPGLGSVFTLTLPLSAPPAALPPTEFDAHSLADPASARFSAGAPPVTELDARLSIDAVAGLTVLIIEQDGDARELLRVALASLGARPTGAADVAAGIDVLLASTPDVLLCDSGLAADQLRVLAAAVDAVQREARDAAPDASPWHALAVIATDAANPPPPANRIGHALPCGGRLRKPVSLRTLATVIATTRSRATISA